MMTTAAVLRDRGHGANVSYSRKVFIPLTKLCRDVCHYCTFAHAAAARCRGLSRRPTRCWRSPAPARRPAASEALFTLGDKPELRYRRGARRRWPQLGYATTLDYLAAMAELVLKETGLLPHLNPGVMSRDDFAAPAPGLGVAWD